jgi:ATP-binding protein involved in chromosome partitioning
MLTQEQVKEALQTIRYPGYSRDIVSFGLVKQIAVANGAINVQIQLTSGNSEVAGQIKADCEKVLRKLPEARGVIVEVKLPATTGGASSAPNPWSNQSKASGIKRIVAVASGKEVSENLPLP